MHIFCVQFDNVEELLNAVGGSATCPCIVGPMVGDFEKLYNAVCVMLCNVRLEVLICASIYTCFR